MKNKTLNILLKPTYQATAKKMGLDPNQVYENDPILFQMGLDMVMMKIKPGAEFSIFPDFEHGEVDCSEVEYKLLEQNSEDEDWDDEFEEDRGDTLILTPGSYFFHADGIIIEKYDRDFEDDYEYNDEDDDEELESDDEVERLVLVAIAESAKRRFDYEDFKMAFHNISDDIARDVLEEAIVGIAANEDLQTVSAKLRARFLLLNYDWNENDIDDFLSDKKEVFKLEIYVLQKAARLLNEGTNSTTVLEFLTKMLH